MQQLTTEEKAKIFHLYSGCDFIINKHTNIHTVEVFKYVVNGKNIDNIFSCGIIYDPKLILTNLFDISDADAIEVAKSYKTNVRGYFATKGVLSELENAELLRAGKETIYLISENKLSNFTPESFITVLDKLRELGYALPYKGQSLFDLNIAIDKNKI